MYTPGISRAVTMGVIGFMVGALLVIIVRALQSLDPVWDTGVGIVFATFFCAGFFVWGIGAFDPRLSKHGEEHEHEEAHAEAAEEVAAPPTAILSSSIWQIAALLIVLVVALAAMSLLGPTLIITREPDAAFNQVGMVPMELNVPGLFNIDFGTVSQLTIFAGFVIFMIVSLAVAAGLLGFVMTFLSQGVAEARSGATAALPAPREECERTPLQWLLFALIFVVLFGVLYALFYFVLIGMVMPGSPMLAPLSLVNALIFTIIIMAPRAVVHWISRGAGWLANLLRGGNLRGGRKVDGWQKPERRKRP